MEEELVYYDQEHDDWYYEDIYNKLEDAEDDND
jgi:hypothetical protein